MMKKIRIILPVVALFIVIAVILVFNTTISYLTDYDKKDNIVTFGKVDIEIDEGDYDEESSYDVEAGSDLPKAPKIINKGTEDAYVFLKVSVPKKDVTLLYEEQTTIGEGAEAVTYKEGTPTVNNYEGGSIVTRKDEIYKMLADGQNIGDLAADGVFTDPDDKPNTKPQLIFEYNKGNASTEGSEVPGWVFLERDTTGSDYDVYYFGYNKRVKRKNDDSDDDETITLFDHIQLKSFIDEELMSTVEDALVDGGVAVNVEAYGIQTDSLGVPGLADDAVFLSDENLQRVFGIVKRKQG